MKDIVIIGAGGFAREVLWLIDDINKVHRKWNVLGFIDESSENHGKVLNGKKILGGLSWITSYAGLELYCVCAIGDPLTKKAIVEKLQSRSICFATLVHPSVLKSDDVEFGDDIIVCAGNIFTVNIKVGNHVIFNLDCTIGHDVAVEDYVTVLPGVNVSGNVTLKEGCNIGANATIIQGISVGEWSVIGAGSVLIKDIPANCTAVGVPAKPIKFHCAG